MKKLRSVLLVLFLGVFMVSGCMLARDLFRSRRERAANRALAVQVQQNTPANAPAAPNQAELPSPYGESGVLRQYDALWQQNGDLAGWLRIEGVEINYPVMYTPQQPEKYLYRDFYGEQASGGSLFLGQDGGPDGPLVIVFGHHMRDGSMFGDLDEYQREEYAREHPVIRLDTLTEEREYEVIAAFRSRVYGVEEQGGCFGTASMRICPSRRFLTIISPKSGGPPSMTPAWRRLLATGFWCSPHAATTRRTDALPWLPDRGRT